MADTSRLSMGSSNIGGSSKSGGSSILGGGGFNRTKFYKSND